MTTALEDVKSSTADPIRYGESGEWVAYTGPKGGKGWQNIQTGKVVYGPQPGTKQESGFPWENEPSQGTGSPTEAMQPMGPLGGGQPAQQPPAQKQPTEQKPAQKPLPEYSGSGPLARTFQAGNRTASMEFSNHLHRDLYDAGAKQRLATKASGKTDRASAQELQAGANALVSKIAPQLGVDEQQVRRWAADAYFHGKEQLKGIQEGEHRKIDAPQDAPWGNQPANKPEVAQQPAEKPVEKPTPPGKTPTPVGAQPPAPAPALKPIGDSIAALKQQHTTMQPNGPALDMGKFGMGLHHLVDSHLKAGQSVSLKIGDTVVPIVGVKNGMLMDKKGQPWGTHAIASGDAELQSGPQQKGVQEGVQVQGGGGTKPPEKAESTPVVSKAPNPQKPQETPVKPPVVQWQPAGQGLWRNTQTGETVASKEAPSSQKTADILGAARAGTKHPSQQPPVKPAAQPGQAKPAQPAQSQPTKANSPVDKAMVQHLDSLPDGHKVGEWTKVTAKGLGIPLWTNEQNHAATTPQMVRKVGIDAVKQHLGQQPQPGQPAGTGRAGGGQQAGPAGQQPARDFSPQERQTIDSVGNLFGIQPGDLGNDKRHSAFLLRTARMVGFNPDSVTGDRTEKTLAAAKFLQSRQAHLESLVQMAQGYGYRGGSARELAHRGRHAGLYLVRAAQARGYQPSGESEQEQIAGAVKHLQEHEQRQSAQQQASRQAVTQALAHLKARFSGGRFSIWDIALAAIGFYVGYKLVRGFRNRRRR